jgi:gliding motility-associated-like protein
MHYINQIKQFSVIRILFIFVIILSFNQVFSQQYKWAKNITGNNQAATYSMFVDNQLNTYITGQFQGTCDFDPGIGIQNLTSSGDWDLFIAKYDSSGNYIWAKRFGDDAAEVGYSIYIQGSSIILGGFYWALSTNLNVGNGPWIHSNNGANDIFIAKYDTSGNYLWSKSIGGNGDDKILKLDVDQSGNIYTIGTFQNIVDFDPGINTLSISSSGNNDIFIAKYSTLGDLIWANKIGGIGDDQGISIKADNLNNAYICGKYSNVVDFDPGLNNNSLSSSGGYDAFLAKYSSNGSYIWSKSIGNLLNEVGNDISITNSGEPIMCGNFEGTVDFNPDLGVFNMNSNGMEDAFLLKLNTNGNFVFAKKFGGSNSDQCLQIEQDAFGNIITSGVFKSNCFFDSLATNITINSSGDYDIYFSKFNQSGDFIFAKKIGNSGFDRIHDMITTPSSNIFIGGSFEGMVDFDPGINLATLSSNYSYCAYFARYIPQFIQNLPPDISLINNISICANDSIPNILFTVADEDISSLVFSVTSSNQLLIPNTGIFVIGTGGNKNLHLNPFTNATGSTIIKIIVTDFLGLSDSCFFTVLISPNPLDINDSIFVSHHGILAHYPFDNHTFDISGHNYHGVLNGPVATTDRLNNSNKAYSFNGNNQFVNVPHDIWSDELSLSAWIYSTDLGTTDPTQTGKMIFFKAPNTGVNQDYTLAVAYINSGFRAQFVFGQGASQFFYVNSNTIIQTNQWYLITATRKNGIAKLYINGNLDNTATYPFIPINQHFNLKLGMSHASSQSFAGKFDDLRIYKRALCAREVKSLYHNQYLLKVKLQDTILCNNGSTFLDIINPEPGISYQLQSYPSGNPIGNPQITYCDSMLSLPTGNITSTSYFTILATDTVTGCSNQVDSIFKVSISPDVIVNLGNDTTICQTNTFVLNAGNVGCTYLWNTGSSASTQNLGISVSGVYSVIVTNIYGCKGFDTINVVFTSFLPVNLGNDTTICIGESVVLDAGISGAIYLWNTNATSQSINVTNAGSYWVAVNSNGCIGSDTIVVNTVPKPTISLGNDTIMCPGDLIILTPGSGFTQYLWSDGATSNSINVNIPGNYSVTVSNGACFVSDEIIIEECGSEIWIPNVFTPNGDGINETFYPVCFNIDKISMLIFNRWGNQIFESSGNIAIWDGKYKGQFCPDGVYYYLIEYEQKGKSKELQKRHGSVTLLR